MNKKIITTIAFSTIIAGSAYAYNQANNANKNVYEAASAVQRLEESPVLKVPHPIENVKPFVGMNNGPNKALLVVEKDYMEQIKKMNAQGEYMNEVSIIINLHAMTHQKIKADRIGFSLKMTPESIDLMIENIEKAPNIEDRENYLAIAKNWKSGNFSQIRDDHDYFNKRQGGTIGYSTGVNSPEEEDTFIKKYYSEKIFSNDI
jgi:hypothetical protein